ncbi:MAG: zinc-binding dehydrogenase [Acidimicrobiales bacterium]|nr:zinc-binding dehydrogenase [Acidimicrobiales bacterium]
MKALRFSRKEARYAAAMVAARLRPGSGASVGPLDLVDDDAPDLPGEDWHRVWPRLTGICGSDLSTIDGHASRYFEDYVSFPFVPGHEIVGDMADGRRVVIEPVLGHAARGFPLPFEGAAPADGNDYRHLTCGHLEPGIQTGFCESTGGGWATEFVAHDSQLHDVPDWMSDELAVTIEPVAGGVHAALRANVEDGASVAVIGAGAMGLSTVAALRHFTDPRSIMIGAKYPVQRSLADEFGADIVVAPSELGRVVRRSSGSFMIGSRLSGGADVVIDAVGSEASIAEAIGLCRPRGRVVMLGMPGVVSVDLTALWHRETELVGTYTYGTETLRDGRVTTSFELAMELAGKVPFDKMVSATYPLDRYTDALEHAANAGARGAAKIAFDLRDEKRRGLPDS